MVTIVDSDGRDLAWLRANRPVREPSRLERLINVVWPLQSVHLWDDWADLEAAALELEFLHLDPAPPAAPAEEAQP